MIRTRTIEVTSKTLTSYREVFPLYCGDLASYTDHNPRISNLHFTVTNTDNYQTAMAGIRIFARAYRDDAGPIVGAFSSRVIPFVDEPAVPFFSFFPENERGVLLPDLKAGLQLVVMVANPNAFEWSFYARVLFDPRPKGDRC